MNQPVIILGAGGHTKVLIDVLFLRSVKILGIVDSDPDRVGSSLMGIRVIGGDEAITQYPTGDVKLVNGLGSIKSTKKRKELFEKFTKLGYSFLSVLHPSAVIAKDAKMGEGVNIMAGAIIQPGASIGNNSIVNTKASVDHDCMLGAHVHVAPGVTLSGGVKIGDGVHIGTGASVVQNITIGKNSLIGAGALVLEDVPADTRVMGMPAKEVQA